MQTIDQNHLLLLRRLLIFRSLISMRKRFAKPRFEICIRVKDCRQDEVEQIPQLANVGLQWSTRQNELALGLVLFRQHHKEFALVVLESMALIYHHIRPLNLLEHAQIGRRHGHFILNNDHMQPMPLNACPKELLAYILISLIDYNIECWSPFVKLELPVRDCRERRYDHKWPLIASGLDEIGKKTNHLNRLAEPHFIRKNSREIVVVEGCEPLHTL
mmetsp:Transcript_89196/g.130462  ORF Transcript_89196/g.130462 Transcript_89196/m.130462 type:complete len:217 (-) Transcript_89196:1704-2354(-)